MLANKSLAGRLETLPRLPAPLVAPGPAGRAAGSNSPAKQWLQARQRQPLRCGRVRTASCLAAASSPVEEGSQQALEGLRAPTTGMAKGLGSFSGGATLQRSKLSQTQKQQSWSPQVDNSGGGGIGGKGIFNGGGGGDDGGDDDDYFDEFGDGDDKGGDGGFFRMLIEENYSKAAIGAVLSEWYRTVETLPLILRQAVEMGLFSSQSLVRFLSMDNRPTVTRTIARSLPSSLSRGLVGRMMADPAFVQKMLMEGLITASSSLFWEAQQRGDRFGKELDLVAINTLTLMAANAALVWSMAPDRSYGNPSKMPWQQMLAKLPNNVWDKCHPQRQYTRPLRAASFLTKAGELALIGTIAGGAQSLLGRTATWLRRRSDPSFQPSVAIPSPTRAALGLGGTMGLFTNTRYQIVAGVDRFLFDYSNFLWSYLALSGVVRLASHTIGEPIRLPIMGLPSGEPAPAAVQRQQQPAVWQRTSAAAATSASAQPGATPRKVKRRVKKVDRGFAMSAGSA